MAKIHAVRRTREGSSELGSQRHPHYIHTTRKPKGIEQTSPTCNIIDANTIRTFSSYEHLRESTSFKYMKRNYTFEAPHMLEAFESIYLARQKGEIPVVPPLMCKRKRT